MSEEPQRSISEILADHAAVTAALGRAAREAVLKHAQAGQPVATWKDGKVVWLQPDEVLRLLNRSKAMTRILLDETLKAKLHNLTQPLELCDETGRVLGRFFPTPDLSQYEPLEPSFNEEELRQQEQANENCYTTGEVVAYLEKL
jgi:hypothetical protein